MFNRSAFRLVTGRFSRTQSRTRRLASRKRSLFWKALEDRRLLTGNPWHNDLNQYDVNGDTLVTIQDARLIEDFINTNGAGAVPQSPGPPFYDVDGDGVISASDYVLELKQLPPSNSPSGTNGTVSMPEDTAYPFHLADLGFSDPSDTPPNQFLAVKIAAPPAVGVLRDNGVSVVAGQFVPASDIAAGLFQFVPAANVNGLASFTFQVQDDGGTFNGGADLDASPNTVTLIINPVNDAPTFVRGPDQTALDTSGPQSVPGWAMAISPGPPNEAGQTLHFTVTASNPGLFAVQPAVDLAGQLSVHAGRWRKRCHNGHGPTSG